MGVNEETGLFFPSLNRQAATYGINFAWLAKGEHIESKCRVQLAYEGPLLIEVEMSPDQQQAPRALNRRNPDGTMNPTKLEDSYPFLDPAIVAKEMEL